MPFNEGIGSWQERKILSLNDAGCHFETCQKKVQRKRVYKMRRRVSDGQARDVTFQNIITILNIPIVKYIHVTVP